MQTRRTFLQNLASGASLAAAPSLAAAGEWRNKQSGMAYRRLGRTGLMVSEVVMGGNSIGPDNHDHVLLALDMGLNYLDTAPAYGRGDSERGYAAVIKARGRDKFFLNTKVSRWDLNRNKLFKEILSSLPASEQQKLKSRAAVEIEQRGAAEPDYICNYFNGQKDEMDDCALANVMEKQYGRGIDRERNYRRLILDSVDESLRRLETDHLDLLMCPHGANSAYELIHYPEIFEAFESLKKAGKVRHLGVSAHNDPAGVLRAAIEAKVYSMAMVAYNIVNQRFLVSALEAAKRNDLGVVAMKVARPVHHGKDYDKADDPKRVRMIEEAVPGPWKVPQKAYLWALQNPNLSAVISEMVNDAMVKDNLPLAGKKLPA